MPKTKSKKRRLRMDHEKSEDYNLLTQYLHEIDSIKLLSREEEIQIAKRSFEGDLGARQHLITANLRFVVSIAKQYTGKGVPLCDLINEGNVGLIAAAEKFDYRKGYHFISYAVWWIKQSIQKAIQEKSKMIRLPLNRVTQYMKIMRFLTDENSYNKDLIADQFAINPSCIEDILNSQKDYISLYKTVKDDKKEMYLHDMIEDPQIEDTDAELLNNDLAESIRQTLSHLTEKEQLVIKHRYGILNHEMLSLGEIGEKVNLSKERIRQIEKNAIKRLKRIPACQQLKSYIYN